VPCISPTCCALYSSLMSLWGSIRLRITSCSLVAFACSQSLCLCRSCYRFNSSLAGADKQDFYEPNPVISHEGEQLYKIYRLNDEDAAGLEAMTDIWASSSMHHSVLHGSWANALNAWNLMVARFAGGDEI
jgi:hypothetical protein